MRLLRPLMLALVMAAGTFVIGWWAVPVIAAVYALVRRDTIAPVEATAAAAAAWLALLSWYLQYPAAVTLLDRLGKVFPVSGSKVAWLAIALASLLAGSAARVVTGLTARARS